MNLTPRNKRARSVSSSSSGSTNGDEHGPSRSPSPQPTPKYHRSSTSTTEARPYLCTLPPTCSQTQTATSFATQSELDKHQEAFHRWICRTPVRDREATAGPSRPRTRAVTAAEAAVQNGSGADTGDDRMSDGTRLPEGFVSGYGKRAWKECGKVFPEERLFELHQTETHDPIARERQARGDRVFACFIPPEQCDKVFLTPAARRKHLIAKHKYPEQYFFAVTNHGINQIAQEDGLAASLIRPRKEGPSLAPYQSSPTKPAATLPTREAGSGAGRDSLPDVDMDDLTERMTDSLAFVPRGVRKKGPKAKVSETAMITEAQ